MNRFDLSTAAPRHSLPEPPADERTGPSLSHGFLLSMMAIMAGDQLSPDNRAFASSADPNGWYHGQVIEELLADLSANDPDLPFNVGKTIFYALKQQLSQFGIAAPADFVEKIPLIWTTVTRGDSGEFRTRLLEPRLAEIEIDVPYDCRFEEGAVVGAMEAFGAVKLDIQHERCVRRGSADFCVLRVAWEE